jgi:glyoxylase-like metal-dependent hydrolase (beta-lactamase superfamily II)
VSIVEFAADDPVHEVLAIRYGTRRTSKADCYLDFASYGEPDAEIVMDYFFYAVRGGGRTVLVDVGFDPAVGARRGRTCLCPPLEALERVGVARESVSEIVLTHLHYDHVGNLEAFPHTPLVLQLRELEFWTGPHGAERPHADVVEAAEIARVARAARDGRIRLLDGSGPIAPGIHAVLVGGHSPGQVALVVRGRSGPIVLASDVAHFYEEVELDRPFAVVVDLEEMLRGFQTLRALSSRPGAVLVAGHDPKVMTQFPGLDGDRAGLGVLIA